MVHSLAYAMATCFDCTKFIYLSDSCVPLQSFDKMYTSLLSSKNMSIFSRNTAFEQGLSEKDARILYFTPAVSINKTQPYFEQRPSDARWKSRHLLPGIDHPLYAVASSQWQVVSRNDARAVLYWYNFFEAWYHNQWIDRIFMTDATVLQTIIMAVCKRPAYFYPLSAQLWKGGDGNRPLTLGVGAQTKVRESAHKKGFLIMRKVKAQDS